MGKQRQILRDNWGETPWATIMFFQCCSLLSVLLVLLRDAQKTGAGVSRTDGLNILSLKMLLFVDIYLRVSLWYWFVRTRLCAVLFLFVVLLVILSIIFLSIKKFFPELNVVYFRICLPSVRACLFFEYIILYNLFSTWKNCSCYC